MVSYRDFKTKYRTNIIYIIFFSLALALLVFSFFVDQYVYDYFIKSPNALLYSLSLFASYSYIILIACIGFYIIFSIYQRKAEKIPAIFLSASLTFVIVIILKIIFARERPEMIVLHTFSILNYSFPATIPALFASSIPIIISGTKNYGFTIFLILVIIAVAFFSLYIGKYFISDIICGIVIGLFIGTIVKIVFKKNCLI